MNGLGIVIFMAQFGAFKTCPYAKESSSPNHPDYFSDCKENERRWMELDESRTWLTLLLVAWTMAIMVAWPKVIPPKYQRVLPSSLVAIIFGTLWEQHFSAARIFRGDGVVSRDNPWRRRRGDAAAAT